MFFFTVICDIANKVHRRLDETAARQRQREEEAEARRASRKAGEPAAAPSRPDAEGERTAPRLNLAPRTGGAPSWRERQAAKEAGGAAGAPAPAPEQPKEEPQAARRPGGYVPPHLRAGANATPSAAPPSDRYVPRPAREPAQPPTRTQAPGPAASEEGKYQKWVPRFRQQQS